MLQIGRGVAQRKSKCITKSESNIQRVMYHVSFGYICKFHHHKANWRYWYDINNIQISNHVSFYPLSNSDSGNSLCDPVKIMNFQKHIIEATVLKSQWLWSSRILRHIRAYKPVSHELLVSHLSNNNCIYMY